ncbi:unnamed protein product [Toxocara canis]|uniref:Secreted protein n=1 Tax=Toxocara canis TaxID=6265 RepID=A0A183U1I5_TOXCA|nr:unnamed protein product [Toxocara canis]
MKYTQWAGSLQSTAWAQRDAPSHFFLIPFDSFVVRCRLRQECALQMLPTAVVPLKVAASVANRTTLLRSNALPYLALLSRILYTLDARFDCKGAHCKGWYT